MTTDTTDRERYLADRVADLEEAQRQAEQRQAEQNSARRAERFQDYEDSLRTAATWPEAIRKQIILSQREANWEAQDPDDGAPYAHFFTETLAACQFAQIALAAELAAIAPDLVALQAQMDALQAQARIAAGHRVAAQSTADGWISVATTLLDPEADIEEWLNW